jgi:hypothetical protein
VSTNGPPTRRAVRVRGIGQLRGRCSPSRSGSVGQRLAGPEHAVEYIGYVLRLVKPNYGTEGPRFESSRAR